MLYLLIVSIIWSLSFSLIKGSLTSLDPFFVALTRLAISLIVFLPFLRLKSIDVKLIPHLIVIGVIQYGLMYSSYIYSYQYLQAYEIAILTIFTPFFVVLISDIWDKKLNTLNWIKAFLAIIGAGIIVYSNETRIGFWFGIILIQVSNFLFALGQVYYKKIIKNKSAMDQSSQYGFIFLGAVSITGIISIISTDFSKIEINYSQYFVLIYLGVIASGLAFFLWNVGVTKVNTGTLAVFNNLKIPLGVLFAVLLIGENLDLLKLLIGSTIIIVALVIDRKYYKSS